MIKAVIFDLDNTLIDFERFKKTCIDAAIKGMISAGLDMPMEQAKREIIGIYENSFYEDPLVFQKFLKKAFGKVDYKLLSAGIVAYRRARPNVMRPYKGVKKTLQKLKTMGLKMAIVSDAPRIKAWLRLTYIGLTDYFDPVLAYEDTGKKKPHEKPFRTALKMMNLEPEEAIFVGDNPERDIKGANKLGMETVLGKYGLWTDYKAPKNPPKDERPDHVIENIKELTGIVKSLK